MVRLIISLFSITSLLGCAWPIYQKLPPQPVLDEFTLCYNNDEIHNNGNLRFDGYYSEKRILSWYNLTDSSLTRIDTITRNIILFDDGLVLMDLKDLNISRIKDNKQNIKNYIYEIFSSSDEKRFFLDLDEWGSFKLKNDTLKVQYFNHPAKLAPWYAIEVWYKVESPNSIIRIDSRKMGITEEERIRRESRRDLSVETLPATFVPLETLPPSDCWLKDQKWFWCNKNDWMEYMEKKESGN